MEKREQSKLCPIKREETLLLVVSMSTTYTALFLHIAKLNAIFNLRCVVLLAAVNICFSDYIRYLLIIRYNQYVSMNMTR